MRPMPNESLKHLEKHAKDLFFPIFPVKVVIAHKVWENLKKRSKYPEWIRTVITFDEKVCTCQEP